VIQEVVLKCIENEHDVVVVSGSFTTRWSELLEFLVAITRMDWRRTITRRLSLDPVTKHCSLKVFTSTIQCLHTLDRIQTEIKGNYYGFEVSPDVKLSYGSISDAERVHVLSLGTVRRMRQHAFTDNRDTIYGCYGLMSRILSPGVSGPMLAPDYRLSDTEVYIQAAWEIIRNTPYLDLLSIVKQPERRKLHTLPSWVPDFSVSFIGAPIINTQITLARMDMPLLDVSGKRAPREAFRLTDQNALVLQGAKLAQATARSPDFNLQRSDLDWGWFMKMLLSHKRRETPDTEESVVEALCRTLLANIWPSRIPIAAYLEA